MEEINIKCKKVSETQDSLRNPIRGKLFNALSPLLPVQSRYFVILSIAKFYDAVVYLNR